jgi:hypothetical protein
VIVPVATVHVASTTDAVGAGGAAGAGLTVKFADDEHPPASWTVTVYPFGASVLNVGDAWKFVPSIEYVYCAPSGAVTVIVPVATVHVASPLMLLVPVVLPLLD